MKWAEELAARSPSLAEDEGGRGGVLGGLPGAEVVHHVMPGRILVGEAILAGDRGGGISQAGGAEGAQQGERQGFVGLSGKKLAPNKHGCNLCPCAGLCCYGEFI